MKKSLIVVLVLVMLCLAACGRSKINSELPENAEQIEVSSYINPADYGDGYGSIIYNGREYVFYGTQCKTIKDSMIKECVGYRGDDTNDRVYTLVDTDDYIAQYYVNSIMMQVDFYRAVDTKDKVIDTPDYIESLGYPLWSKADNK